MIIGRSTPCNDTLEQSNFSLDGSTAIEGAGGNLIARTAESRGRKLITEIDLSLCARLLVYIEYEFTLCHVK